MQEITIFLNHFLLNLWLARGHPMVPPPKCGMQIAECGLKKILKSEIQKADAFCA
jgi:hypothetical protein